ncbi:MAG: hypothetical protein U0514_01535 [Candidatus Andersenbacteria bacterium]
MGFWSDVVRSINPFAKADLSTPEARERAAYKAASSLYFLQYVRPKVHNDLRLATAEAARHVQQGGRDAKAWSTKYGFLRKYGYSLKHEESRAFRDSGSLPPDIKQRAAFIMQERAGEFASQYPPRDFAPFNSFSPAFIRKY